MVRSVKFVCIIFVLTFLYFICASPVYHVCLSMSIYYFVQIDREDASYAHCFSYRCPVITINNYFIGTILFQMSSWNEFIYLVKVEQKQVGMNWYQLLLILGVSDEIYRIWFYRAKEGKKIRFSAKFWWEVSGVIWSLSYWWGGENKHTCFFIR